MRIEKAQGYSDRVDIITEREEKKRYSIKEIQDNIHYLEQSITKFQQKKEYLQDIYAQAQAKIKE